MKDIFVDEQKRKGISLTAVIIICILIIVLSSSLTYFFMPTITVGNVNNTPTSTLAPLPTTNPDGSGNKGSGYYDFSALYSENCQTVVILDSYITKNGQSVQYSQSSGFIISNDGYILTNSHCVKDMSKVEVTLYNGNTYDAKIIGYDERTEVAVIKITPNETLKVATLGNSDEVKIGSCAIAIGNPLGYEFSMSVGYISGVKRIVDTNNNSYEMLQMDIAINSGNSGGPLFNTDGLVIGINTMKSSSSASSATVEGMGFAIPINIAKEISSQLINNGKVTRAALDVMVGNTADGVMIAEVVSGGAAEKAGLKANDIILKYNDIDISTVSDLTGQLNKANPGDKVKITVLRDKIELTFDVILGTT